jgi:undecaprenyl-diphosphatase
MKSLDAIILGIVEGITEFLPISSTGHLILASAILGLPNTEFQKSFEIAIQLGAILSVVVLYARSLLTDFKKILKVFVAFLPTAIIGLLAYKAIKHYLLGNAKVVVLSLLIGGIFLIAFEYFYARKSQSASPEISYPKAFTVGLFQSISMIPGVSRAAATIIGGLSIGIDRRTIVEFSFLLAIPTMAAATGLDLLKTGLHFSSAEWHVLAIGFIVSFTVALLSIKFLLHYIQRHTFIAFGIYRIMVAVLFWFFLIKK